MIDTSPSTIERLLDATYRAEQRHFWFHGFRRFVEPLLRQAATGLTAPRILDAGCGTGANLEMLARFGRAYGVDLSWTGLRYAHHQGRTRIARATVTHLPFADCAFDVLTSFDVLYCLPEPYEAEAVADMFRVLRPGGAAVINVAALDILRGSHSVLGAEVRRYRRATLRALLERAGFEIVRLTYTNATLFPLMLAVRLAQRATGRADEGGDQDLHVPSAPVNAGLSAMLRVEAAMLRLVDMPFGSSLLCLARKPA